MVSPKKKHSLLVFLRAQLSAQFATLVDFVLTFVCFRWFGLYYLLATSIGSIAGGIINCIINYKWTFATKDCQFKWVFLKYILVGITMTLKKMLLKEKLKLYIMNKAVCLKKKD